MRFLPFLLQVASVIAAVGLHAQPAFASIDIEEDAGEGGPAARACIDAPALRAPLAEILERHEAGSLAVTVRLIGAANVTSVSLAVHEETGELLLERSYGLAPEDCPSAPDLLAVVLERFLLELPRDRPRPLPVPAPVAVSPSRAPLHATLAAAGNAGVPSGFAGQVDGRATRALSRGFFATAGGAVRAAPLRAFAGGSYQETALLATLGAGRESNGWVADLVAAGGTLRVQGWGFPDTRTAWLPWIEATASVRRRWGDVSAGPEVGVSPLRHRVVTSDGRNARQIPNIHCGFRIDVAVGKKVKQSTASGDQRGH